MSHIDLTNEVIRQLSARFQPSPTLIKSQIEVMLENVRAGVVSLV
jgi:hypothetical protein